VDQNGLNVLLTFAMDDSMPCSRVCVCLHIDGVHLLALHGSLHEVHRLEKRVASLTLQSIVQTPMHRSCLLNLTHSGSMAGTRQID